MAQRRIVLLALIVATVLMACAAALLAVPKEAQATFPGKNGKIAYVSDQVIYTVKPNGEGKTKVTEGIDPSYSPDGKKIAYAASDGTDYEIYAINAQGGCKSQLTNNDTDDTDPAYSPNGEKIAYLRYDGTDNEIYTINVRTGDRAQLTNNKETEEEPSYSPDGKSIAYMSYAGHDNEIYTINASGENKTQLTNNDKDDFDPNYSPDGKRIVYWAYDGSPTRGYQDGEIYTMNAFDGGGKLKLTHNNGKDDVYPSYSPDGKSIVYKGLKSLQYNDGGGAIYTISAGGGEKFRVTDTTERCGRGCYIYSFGELSWGASVVASPPNSGP